MPSDNHIILESQYSCLVAGSWKDMTKKFRDGMANEVGGVLKEAGAGVGASRMD